MKNSWNNFGGLYGTWSDRQTERQTEKLSSMYRPNNV